MRSFGFASALVCYCMFPGASASPRQPAPEQQVRERCSLSLGHATPTRSPDLGRNRGPGLIELFRAGNLARGCQYAPAKFGEPVINLRRPGLVDLSAPLEDPHFERWAWRLGRKIVQAFLIVVVARVGSTGNGLPMPEDVFAHPTMITRLVTPTFAEVSDRISPLRIPVKRAYAQGRGSGATRALTLVTELWKRRK